MTGLSFRGAEWQFNHDWVATTTQALWDALQYSPLGISVYAWVNDKDGLYYKPDTPLPNGRHRRLRRTQRLMDFDTAKQRKFERGRLEHGLSLS